MTRPDSALPALAALVASVLVIAPFGPGCSRESHADPNASRPALLDPLGKDIAVVAPQASCGHAACGSNFFVDAAVPSACSAGASCVLTLTLVATGAYHINDDYPYKFRADDGPGIRFLGKSDADGDVFSKAAGDWTKKDERTGTIAITFRAASPGSRVVSGIFKLSVCSAQSCQLEQQAIQASVTVR
ncbi:MAG: hypothetical protein M3O50_01830 [Myxococcota bacterium]|nr:hypothetical protein [Myxococcota bacterium]